MTGRGESGIALVTVLVVLGSIGLLAAGTFSLVSESTRSASQQIRFEGTRNLSVSGLDRAAVVIDQVTIPGFNPAAPGGYGVRVSSTANDGQWNSLQDFADYLRDQISRANGDGPQPCTAGSPDLEYQVQTDSGTVEVRGCVVRQAAGALPGSGAGPVFAKSSGSTASSQSLFRVTIWAEGPSNALGQMEAAVRGIY